MDSLASLDLPAWGYGLHYTSVSLLRPASIPAKQIFFSPCCRSYGMFKQLIRGGEQKEVPDKWLDEGNPWEITRCAASSRDCRVTCPARHVPAPTRHTSRQAGRGVPRALLRQRGGG